jgi:uncharacterized protein (DUF1786 family)
VKLRRGCLHKWIGGVMMGTGTQIKLKYDGTTQSSNSSTVATRATSSTVSLRTLMWRSGLQLIMGRAIVGGGGG